MRAYAYKGKGVGKSVLGSVRTKWMAPNNCCGIFFCGLVGPITLKHHRQQGKSRYFLSYAIIRIYTILHIYLQVSETEGLAELH